MKLHRHALSALALWFALPLLARLALTRGGRHLGCSQRWHAQCPSQLTVVAEGWSTADELPIYAEVELTDGGPWRAGSPHAGREDSPSSSIGAGASRLTG